ncbi:MAG: hypothetical protein PHE67_12060 [Campylobacterales bacterium]|nr:hypothetical protein [Campylobacterales bacterium]
MLGSPKQRCPWKYSLRQKIWNYMRRNPVFRVGDIMLALDLEQKSLKQMFWYLTETGYIRLDTNGETYEDRTYTLMKNTGIKVPSMVKDTLYDYNTKQEIKIERKKISATDIKNVVFEALHDGEKSTAELLSKINGHRASLSRVIKEMLKNNEIVCSKWGHYTLRKDDA